MQEEKVFCQLEMPMLELKDKNDRRYYVYKDSKEFVEVDADTAQDAIQQSEVSPPYKVVHMLCDLDKIMGESDLIRVENSAPSSDITKDSEIPDEGALGEKSIEADVLPETSESSDISAPEADSDSNTVEEAVNADSLPENPVQEDSEVEIPQETAK